MTECRDAPLAASADMDECESSPPTGWPCCCTTMATPSSRCSDGCTVLALCHYAVSIYAAVHYLRIDCYPVAGACAVAYVLLQCVAGAPAHIAQAVLCVVAAADSAACAGCTHLIWMTLLAAIVHFGIAMAIYEMQRIGDCRTCLNEAHACSCGKRKRALPPGTLSHLVSCVEAHWVPLAQREAP